VTNSWAPIRYGPESPAERRKFGGIYRKAFIVDAGTSAFDGAGIAFKRVGRGRF